MLYFVLIICILFIDLAKRKEKKKERKTNKQKTAITIPQDLWHDFVCFLSFRHYFSVALISALKYTSLRLTVVV